ncbi:hypothetical protein VTL71DRAFT_9230 [Oculimacula yallundae]|uniref:Uncharacterized protein n=1 Tax=Oculimacula yallundae TaxID=86028 RepID=A0ABR4BU62_9HELO
MHTPTESTIGIVTWRAFDYRKRRCTGLSAVIHASFTWSRGCFLLRSRPSPYWSFFQRWIQRRSSGLVSSLDPYRYNSAIFVPASEFVQCIIFCRIETALFVTFFLRFEQLYPGTPYYPALYQQYFFDHIILHDFIEHAQEWRQTQSGIGWHSRAEKACNFLFSWEGEEGGENFDAADVPGYIISYYSIHNIHIPL